MILIKNWLIFLELKSFLILLVNKMSNIIESLREPKLNMGGMELAYFDLIATIGGGYIVADKMKWNKPATILGAFIAGHLAHNMTGTITPLTSQINQSFAPRRVDGITTADLPINNSTIPVGLNETRFSTM